jgi:MYXO-CTERM domain-containing protein
MRARAFLFASTIASAAWAFPSPDTTAVLYNADVPESVALAQAYQAARAVPQNQMCKVSVVDQPDISLADYNAKLFAPLQKCLMDGGALSRIEAVMIMRGIPIIVATPDNASVAAALGAWTSTLDGTTTPLVGQPPGMMANCGGPCLAAQWPNPLKALVGPYGPGMVFKKNGVEWHPVIATMLHGRTYADAQKLLQSALDAEMMGGAKSEFLFMDGADMARGVLDNDATTVMPILTGLGFTTNRVPFNANLTGKSLAGFATGTASIGTTIEGNTYLPGSIVDNLTSYGAVPVNFAMSGETQVSIARWVAKGVAGAHGTVDEPLNNVFPSRRFISDYASGAPLGEAYHRRLPYAYWRNLVLGDPMAAPYAKRPTVAIDGLKGGQVAGGAVSLHVTATDVAGTGIGKIKLYVDGALAGEADGDMLDACIMVPAKDKVQVLAVAQNAPGMGALANFPPKGWLSLVVDGRGKGPADCEADAGPDAGPAMDTDGGTTMPMQQGGCSCDVGSANPSSGIWALVVLGLVRRRKQR